MIRTTLLAIASLATIAQADVVTVEIKGDVSFNGVRTGPLSAVSPGECATMSFTLDSDLFTEGLPGDTRGYVIDASSFALTFEDGVVQPLVDPFPGGQTPYFTVVDGFPVSDGFWVSTSQFSPGGVPIEQEPYQGTMRLGYEGTTLTSLDLLDALGTYNFGGLTSFEFGIWVVFPDNVVMDINFVEMTIAVDLPADLNGDGMVGPADLALLLDSWGMCPEGACVADINGDGMVGPADLAALLDAWT